MIYFAADHHFGHANLIRYLDRPFATVHEMDEEMIYRWNSVVSLDDHVYYPGDFTRPRCEDAAQYFVHLNGHIHVIPGGHDYHWIRAQCDWVLSRSGPVEILDPLYVLRFGERDPDLIGEMRADLHDITLCHYCMLSWHRSHYNTWLVHGHHHCKGVPSRGKVMNVCMDHHDFYPVSLPQVVEHMAGRPNNWNFTRMDA